MIPSEAKVEWSKSPSGSVEEIEAKSSIQPFAWSPLRLTSFPNEPNLDTTFIKEIRPDGCTPPLDRSIRAWDPIGPLFWMCKLLAVLRGLRPHRSDRELFQTLSLTWLGQSFRLPSTEYKKPYNCLTCWHPGEESHYLCHIFKFERRLSCYLSNYRHWSDRARERKKTIAHAPHSPFTNIIEGKVKAA
jgi:hypothetical protein